MMTKSKGLFFATAFLSLFACKEDPKLGTTPTRPQGVEIPSRPVELFLVGEQTVYTGLEELAVMRVEARYENGAYASDLQIQFAVTPSNTGAQLGSTIGVTNAQGRAEVQVRSPNLPAEFEVVATANQPDPSTPKAEARLKVIADGRVLGGLRVRFTNPGPVDINSIQTRVHSDAIPCDDVVWPVLPMGIGEQVAVSVTSMLQFDGLEADRSYSVTAVATTPAGRVVARGCAQTPVIVGRSVVDSLLTLELEQVQLEGDYDFATNLRLNEALPEPYAAIIQTIDDVFHDPAGVLVDFLVGALADFAGVAPAQVNGGLLAIFGGQYTDTDSVGDPGYGSILDEMLDDQVLGILPSWITNGLTIGGDVTNLMTNLGVGGTMEIANVDHENGTWSGDWSYSDFMFEWRFGEDCDPSDSCCGRTIFSGDEIGVTPIGSGADEGLSGAFFKRTLSSGGIHNSGLEYDFTMDEARLELQYGSLILFVIERFVFPAIFGEDSLECAVESVLGCSGGGTFVCDGQSTGTCGCDRIGEWLSGSIGNLVGLDISPELGATACGLAVDGVANLVRNRLNQLTYGGSDGTYFAMSMNDGVLKDTSRDLQLDAMFKDISSNGNGNPDTQFERTGTVAGQLYIGGDAKGGFTGDMHALRTREGCDTLGDSESCSFGTCGEQANTLNECQLDLVCRP